VVLFKEDTVRKNHPKVLEWDIQTHTITMERIGVPLSTCDNNIIQVGLIFCKDYLSELHKKNLYHGDLVRRAGCGFHLDNVLYDEISSKYYIIDFNSLCDVESEKATLKSSQTYCPNLVRKKRLISHVDGEHHRRRATKFDKYPISSFDDC
jgi:serine/threonine protein kinase